MGNRTLAGTALVAVSALCVSCAQSSGLPLLGAPDRTPVAIGIDSASAEQVALGEIYSRILDQMGYAVGVTSLPPRAEADAIEVLRTEQIDLVVTCTGALLNSQNPAAARELAASGEEGEALSQATYDATVGTFPTDVRTVDPSPAHGCADLGPDELPQNIIPVFVDGTFDRATVNRINFITRVMATEDIAEAAERIEGGEPIAEAVGEWLMEYAGIAPREA